MVVWRSTRRLSKWAKQQIACGMFEPVISSPWASSSHIAHKAIRGTPKDDNIFDIIIAGIAYIRVKQQFSKFPNPRLNMCNRKSLSQAFQICFSIVYIYPTRQDVHRQKLSKVGLFLTNQNRVLLQSLPPNNGHENTPIWQILRLVWKGRGFE